ncbi:bifunctional diaminohydroxyphosphoribosylaminopyrimidine deaminase/5-amino-6-(5-phosphoribosylamino)uracil reductase RibD [Eubacteriales bacterium KG127]
MGNTNDVKYMEHALRLAAKGEGFTSPNPMVGAVIVKDGKILSEGYHHACGLPHAERVAIGNATNTEDLKGSTMYVTLEPCCHYGKTPPCTEAIIEYGISEVFCAMEDPNPVVAGKGIAILREHGIKVHTGLLEDKARALNQVFITKQLKQRPFVAIKVAETIDGKIASFSGKSQWITGENSRLHSHSLRHKYMSILVGINTVLADDPMLNYRLENGVSPVRILLDSNLRIPTDCKLVKTAKEILTIVATTEGCITGNRTTEKIDHTQVVESTYSAENKHKIEELKQLGVKILTLPSNQKGQICLDALLKELAAHPYNIDSVLVEGGGTVHESFLRSGLADYAHIYMAPKFLGGKNALSGISGEGFDDPNNCPQVEIDEIKEIDKDIYFEGKVVYPCSQE